MLESRQAYYINLDMEGHQSELNTFFKHEEQQYTITGLTPPKQNISLKVSQHFEGVNHASTSVNPFARLDRKQRSVYQLNPKILQHTPITEFMRARLRSFIMSQGRKQMLYRQTIALACTYIDLYFMNKGEVPVDKFQSMVISCLIIASKTRQSLPPKISYDVFSKEQLLNFEQKVLLRLNFNLNPITYYEYAQRIILQWDEYVQREKVYNMKFSEQKSGINYKLRKIFEQLDYAYMALATLQYQTQEIVVNLFYLRARMLNVYQIQSVEKLSDQQFCKIFYPQKDLFVSFFSKFLKLEYKYSLQLNPSVGCYLKHFLSITPEKGSWPYNSSCEAYEKIRVWDSIQTQPKNCYQNIKQIIPLLKRTV